MLNYQSDQRMMLTRTPINTLGGEFFFSIGSSPLFSINTPLPPYITPPAYCLLILACNKKALPRGLSLAGALYFQGLDQAITIK